MYKLAFSSLGCLDAFPINLIHIETSNQAEMLRLTVQYSNAFFFIMEDCH